MNLVAQINQYHTQQRYLETCLSLHDLGATSSGHFHWDRIFRRETLHRKKNVSFG